MQTIDQSVVEKWRASREVSQRDAEWVAHHKERDLKRIEARKELGDLLKRFLAKRMTLESFRSEYHHRTRNEWSVFGLKGLSGAMFLNMLAKNLPDSAATAKHLRDALTKPADDKEASAKLQGFYKYLDDLIDSGQVSRNRLQPARLPFFVSTWWHVQDIEGWPVFYPSARRALEAEAGYVPQSKPDDDYLRFRQVFQVLRTALDLSSWELEHLCVWIDQGESGQASTPEEEISPVEAAEEEPAPDSYHAKIQLLLARIGRKLGYKVWIAKNDHSRIVDGQKLGDLSISTLPSLSVGLLTDKLVRLIDVVWLTGVNQVKAAFEVEHTTSVHSGLLRMADLVALLSNITFQLYVVAPADRKTKVINELSRPTFQRIELHQYCGFISSEDLEMHAASIMKFASDVKAINALAVKAGDVAEGDVRLAGS